MLTKTEWHKIFTLSKLSFRLKNENSYLGILWYLLDPLLFFSIIIFLRSFIRGADAIEYPLYLISGLVIYNLFRGVGQVGLQAIRGYSTYIKNTTMKKDIFVLSKVLTQLYAHFFELIIVSIFLLYYTQSLIGLLYYLLILPLYILFLLGIAYFNATVGIFIKDYENVWAIIARSLRFVSPVFFIFPTDSVPYFFNLFNPLNYYITILRNGLLGIQTELFFYGISLILSILSFVIGFYVFQKYQSKLVEYI